MPVVWIADKGVTPAGIGHLLGMQLMCRHSEEGDVDCLGIFDTDVKRFISQRHEDKVPHMGWNTIARTNSGLFKGFTKEEFVYFVHSFYVPVSDCTAAVTDYIHPFSALCIKTITTPHSSIRKRVEVWESVFCGISWNCKSSNRK